MADLGGIKLAYDAYTETLNNMGFEGQLPGLVYTNRQMFWISSVQGVCTKMGKDAFIKYIEEGTHPPMKFRIDASFSNIPDFSRDFNCKDGSKMNPINKYEIW